MITPDQYREKYKPLRSMAGTDGMKYAFGNGTANHNKPLVTRVPREVLTGIRSFDPRLRDFLIKLTNDLNENIKPDLDQSGFTRNGVHTTFDRLRTVSGYMSNPMSFTALDNTFYRESLGLKTQYTAVQKQIATNVWKILWSQYHPSAVKATRRSAGGPRRNTSDIEWKMDFASFVYESDNFERILNAVDKDDWLTLADQFEMLIAMYIQKRDQVDTPGKVRTVFSKEYALSNGKVGSPQAADKDVFIDSQKWEGFSATRTRVVFAGPWAVNCILSIMSTGTMKSMFERFPDTFHVNTAEEIKSVIDGKHIYCSDVTEYDRSMSADAINTALDAAEEFWDPRLVKLARLLFFSPYFARPLELDGKRGTWVGDPRDFSPQVVAGNKSGHAFTSLIAKGNKVIETLFVFHEMGLSVLGNELLFLESKAEINMINNGDDEVVHTPNGGLMDKFINKRQDKDSGHYVVTREDGAGYSGLLLIPNDDPEMTYTPIPRLHTGFEKIYVPERSIGGIMRPFWHVGITERINNRDAHPLGGFAWEIHDKLYRDMLEPHFGSIINMLVTAEERAPLKYNAFTSIDREVLEDPDKIHYKYLDNDVSPVVLDHIVSRIPPEQFEHVYTKYYKGVVH